MATFNKFNTFTENLLLGKHILSTGALTVALSSVAPTAAGTSLASITQIAYTNLPTSRVCSGVVVSTSGGVAKLVISDMVLTATGAVASFQYVTLYNATATSFELIGWYDYGSAVVMANLETFTIDFDASAGVLTLT